MDGDITVAEFLEQTAQSHEDMAMVISRIPAVAEDPTYAQQRAEVDAMVLDLLDKRAAIIAVLAEEEGK